jgi:hypothetical protein
MCHVPLFDWVLQNEEKRCKGVAKEEDIGKELHKVGRR